MGYSLRRRRLECQSGCVFDRADGNRHSRGEVGLVEVVVVGHEGSVGGCERMRSMWSGCRSCHKVQEGGREALTLKDDGRVRSNEHSHTTGSSSGSGRALRVDGNVTGEHDGVSSVPRGRLDPVDGVEERGRSSIAGVLGVDTLNVGVTVRLEQVHKNGLDRLGLVNDGLGSDVESTDRLGVDVVLLEETSDGYRMNGREDKTNLSARCLA